MALLFAVTGSEFSMEHEIWSVYGIREGGAAWHGFPASLYISPVENFSPPFTVLPHPVRALKSDVNMSKPNLSEP